MAVGLLNFFLERGCPDPPPSRMVSLPDLSLPSLSLPALFLGSIVYSLELRRFWLTIEVAEATARELEAKQAIFSMRYSQRFFSISW